MSTMCNTVREHIRNIWVSYPKLLIFCGLFYSILCIFSIVSGIVQICSSDLAAIELNDAMISAIQGALTSTGLTIGVFFGLVTILVGILQGLAAFAIWKGHSKIGYWYALGFTVFSLLSCSSKLFMSVNLFSIAKIIVYILVIVILIMGVSRAHFWRHTT